MYLLISGFPVVTVKRDYKNNKIELEQERFILMAPSTNLSLISEIKKPIWWVPITYTSKSRMNFNETKPKHWMKV